MSIQARRKQREEENMDRKAEKAQQHRWVGWVSVFGWNLLGKLSAKKMWLKYGFILGGRVSANPKVLRHFFLP